MNINGPELKPWKSMEGQLQVLIERGMRVDKEEAALSYLARIGYYRLSGYWYPLRKVDMAKTQQKNSVVRLDDFTADSHFETVVKLYVFDKKLRLLALDALERIELAIRVDIAYLLGQRNPLAHEDPACLHGNFAKRAIKSGPNKGRTKHELWLQKHSTLVRRARREPFIVHHRQKYQDHLPVWVAIEVWDFGLLSHLFSGLKYADKQKIAAKYGVDGDTLGKWLKSLNFIRNVSAHHSRLWNINVLEVSPPLAAFPEMKNTKPFMYFVIMARLMDTICPNSSWAQRVIELLLRESPLSENGALSLKDFGVCQNWREALGGGRKEN